MTAARCGRALRVGVIEARLREGAADAEAPGPFGHHQLTDLVGAVAQPLDRDRADDGLVEVREERNGATFGVPSSFVVVSNAKSQPK